MSKGKIYEYRCLTCGKYFKDDYRTDCKFCSTTCYHRGHSLGLTLQRKAVIHNRICQYCEKPFEIKYRKVLGLNEGKYCSLDCANKAQGLMRVKRSGVGDRAAIEKAKISAVCEICGYNRFIEIAHIVPATAGGKYIWDNTFFCCPNHHRLFDHRLLDSNEIQKLPEKARVAYLENKTYNSKIYQEYKLRHKQRPKRITPLKDKNTGKFISREKYPEIVG